MRRLLPILLVIFLVSAACQAQQRWSSTPTITPTRTPIPETSTAFPTLPPHATATEGEEEDSQPTPSLTSTPAPFACDASPSIAAVIEETTAERWIDWIEKLSGAEPVIIDGEETVITTRYSPAMFDDQPNARAFEFVHETISGWYPADQIEIMDYTVRDSSGEEYTWQNLILTIPGTAHPDEVVIFSAHLDSTAEDPYESAPGAEDNASGSAALLEAARLFADMQFARTVEIIWFTGEEQGLLGSSRYVDRLEDADAVIGVLNLDMFGYDSDGDACFEMHVGTLPASDKIGQCFVQTIDEYDIPLERYDYLTTRATDRSDHGSFWEEGIGAIEILENMFDENIQTGCPNGDPNENYHTDGDTVDKLNPETGIRIVRAALATVASMAQPVE